MVRLYISRRHVAYFLSSVPGIVNLLLCVPGLQLEALWYVLVFVAYESKHFGRRAMHGVGEFARQ